MTNTKTSTTMSFLTELERDSLAVFAQNEVMKEALKKVLLDGILNMGVQEQGKPTLMQRNWVFGIDPQGIMTPEQFGTAVKVRTEAMILLEQSYNKLNELVPQAPEPKIKNKAL